MESISDEIKRKYRNNVLRMRLNAGFAKQKDRAIGGGDFRGEGDHLPNHWAVTHHIDKCRAFVFAERHGFFDVPQRTIHSMQEVADVEGLDKVHISPAPKSLHSGLNVFDVGDYEDFAHWLGLLNVAYEVQISLHYYFRIDNHYLIISCGGYLFQHFFLAGSGNRLMAGAPELLLQHGAEFRILFGEQY